LREQLQNKRTERLRPGTSFDKTGHKASVVGITAPDLFNDRTFSFFFRDDCVVRIFVHIVSQTNGLKMLPYLAWYLVKMIELKLSILVGRLSHVEDTVLVSPRTAAVKIHREYDSLARFFGFLGHVFSTPLLLMGSV
jgi:hypothetical protein